MKRHIALVLVVLITVTSFSGCGTLIKKGKELILNNEKIRPGNSVVSRPADVESTDSETSDEESKNGVGVIARPTESESMTDETSYAPTQNSYKNLIDGMSTSERKKINIFLSNFSEVHFWDYDRYGDIDYYRLINFAYLHNAINTGKIDYTEEKIGIAGETAAATVKKYLGVNLPLKTTYDGYGRAWEYTDGWFWTEPEMGGLNAFFSIAHNMVDNGNGTYTVYFEVFSVDSADTTPSKCYEYTLAKAKLDCCYEYSGTAVVKEKTYNGNKTYELISYKPD